MTANPRAMHRWQTAGPGVYLPADVAALGDRVNRPIEAQRAVEDLLSHIPESNPTLRARLVQGLLEAGR